MKYLLILILIGSLNNALAQKINYDVTINNVNVIDVKTSKTNKQFVYIKDGKVSYSKLPFKNATTTINIDGSYKYLMPALWDMHVHFPDANAERFFQLQVAAGVQNVRIMKSDDATVAFEKKNTLAPKMKIAYNFFGNETYNLDSVKIVIDGLKTKGYDLIKCFGVRDEAFFDAVMQAAKQNNIIVCGHALGKVSAKKVLQSGYKSIEHVGYFDKAKNEQSLDNLIALAKKHNVFICPTLDWTLMAYHSIPHDSLQFRAGYNLGYHLYKKEWDSLYAETTKQLGQNAAKYADYMRTDVDKKISILSKLRKAGVRIIAGSDAEEPFQTPGFSLLDELKLIQKAGFTNAELLKMITINAANFFNEKLDPNQFILLDKNPLLDINNFGTVTHIYNSKKLIDCKKLLAEIQ
jgi:imidazolonepropionase-like amidohydrolase